MAIKLSTWKIPMAQPVKKRLKRKKGVVERPTVTVNCKKNKGGKDTANQYTMTYCFLQRKPKWWQKLFFWVWKL